MGRYLIVLGKAIEPVMPSGDWRVALDAPGIWAAVCGLADEAHRCAGQTSLVVLGDFYEQKGALLAERCAGASQRLARIVDNAWGRYIALARDGEGPAWSVMRDPSGRISCYVAATARGVVVFSHIEDARALGAGVEGVDWANVAALIQAPRLRNGATGLKGVFELLPGQAINEAGECSLIWSPGKFATERVIEDRPAARAALADAVEASVAQAAKREQHILQLLSGGLDSSVMLACLAGAQAGEKTTCLTFTQGPGSELDETRYARLAAAAAGVELREARLDPTRVRLEEAAAFAAAPRPQGYVFSIETDAAEAAAARACGASACFSAAGGDGLFYQLRAKIFCADFVLRHGPMPGAFQVALDNARLARVSVWTILRETWALAWGHKAFAPEAAARNPYLSRDVSAGGADWLQNHPWFEGALSPGKRLHLWAVLDCLNLFYPFTHAETAPTEFPLISQKLIETVLAIPAYVLTSGGQDRALLREAFSGRAPGEILARSSKGAMDGYYSKLCASNAQFIRERLLDGVLIRQGLLERAKLERDLPRRGDPRDGCEMTLLHLLDAELWAHAWVRR